MKKIEFKVRELWRDVVDYRIYEMIKEDQALVSKLFRDGHPYGLQFLMTIIEDPIQVGSILLFPSAYINTHPFTVKNHQGEEVATVYLGQVLSDVHVDFFDPHLGTLSGLQRIHKARDDFFRLLTYLYDPLSCPQYEHRDLLKRLQSKPMITNLSPLTRFFASILPDVIWNTAEHLPEPLLNIHLRAIQLDSDKLGGRTTLLKHDLQTFFFYPRQLFHRVRS